MMLLLLRLWLA